jgi:signal transduction histidine kinase
MPIVSNLQRIHAAFMLGSVIAVAANLISVAQSGAVFSGLSVITAGFIGYIAYKAIRAGDLLGKCFMFGAGISGLCLVLEWINVKSGARLPLAWLPQWGVLAWVCMLLATIRLQMAQAEEQMRSLARKLESENKILKKVFQAARTVNNHVAEDNQTLAVKLRERSERLQQVEGKLSADRDIMQKTRERLVEAERLSRLGSMVAGLAHELNTPLGVGVTAASNLEKEIGELQELYESGAMKKSDLERYLQISGESAAMILANLRGASELIKSFKTVAADQNRDNGRVFMLKEYLEQILLSLKPRIAQTPHCIKLTCSDYISLYGRPGAFSQIITNLVMNSLTHAFDSGQAGTISIDAFSDSSHMVIRFADNGRGIPPDVLPHIFEPFFTTSKDAADGTGLGLHIVQSIITEHFNGSITCESRLGKGTAFYLRFPIREEIENER